MSRVVITGLGIISCLGNNQEEVLKSLQNGDSGLSINQDYIDNGMRCHVSGQVSPDLETIDRKMLRFMSETSAYAFLSTQEAIKIKPDYRELLRQQSDCVMQELEARGERYGQ